MGRSKGYEGESCADAIRQSFRSGETVAFRDLYPYSSKFIPARPLTRPAACANSP